MAYKVVILMYIYMLFMFSKAYFLHLSSRVKEERKPPPFVKFDDLIQHFQEVQDRKLKEKKTPLYNK